MCARKLYRVSQPVSKDVAAFVAGKDDVNGTDDVVVVKSASKSKMRTFAQNHKNRGFLEREECTGLEEVSMVLEEASMVLKDAPRVLKEASRVLEDASRVLKEASVVLEEASMVYKEVSRVLKEET